MFWYDLRHCGSEPWLVSTDSDRQLSHRFQQFILSGCTLLLLVTGWVTQTGTSVLSRPMLHPFGLEAPGAQGAEWLYFSWHVRDGSTGCEFPHSEKALEMISLQACSVRKSQLPVSLISIPHSFLLPPSKGLQALEVVKLV